MVEVARKELPGIKNWFVNYYNLVGALLPVADRDLVGHQDLSDNVCSVKQFPTEEPCQNGSDFFIVALIMRQLEGDVDPVIASSKIRYFCAPCAYVAAVRGLRSIGSSKSLENAIEHGLSALSAEVLDSKAAFLENAVEQTSLVLEDKYSGNYQNMLEKSEELIGNFDDED